MCTRVQQHSQQRAQFIELPLNVRSLARFAMRAAIKYVCVYVRGGGAGRRPNAYALIIRNRWKEEVREGEICRATYGQTEAAAQCREEGFPPRLHCYLFIVSVRLVLCECVSSAIHDASLACRRWRRHRCRRIDCCVLSCVCILSSPIQYASEPESVQTMATVTPGTETSFAPHSHTDAA